MALPKWRVINNNKIQSWRSHIWLWDKVQGVAVKVAVEQRPWTKINKDFTHWLASDDTPTYQPEGVEHIAKEQAMEMLSGAISRSTAFPMPTFSMPDDDDEEDDEYDFAF